MTEKTPGHKHLHERERGQSLVEMAFGLIIIVTLFFGLVDLGRAYFVLIAMEDAAGEAVMFLSVMPGCEAPDSNPDPTTTDECAGKNNAIYRYRNAAGTELDWDASALALSKPSHRICRDILDDGTCLPTSVPQPVGDQYVIELNYNFELLTPIIADLAGSGSIELTVKASQLVLSE